MLLVMAKAFCLITAKTLGEILQITAEVRYLLL